MLCELVSRAMWKALRSGLVQLYCSFEGGGVVFREVDVSSNCITSLSDPVEVSATTIQLVITCIVLEVTNARTSTDFPCSVL